jgi:hypothetical protein
MPHARPPTQTAAIPGGTTAAEATHEALSYSTVWRGAGLSACTTYPPAGSTSAALAVATGRPSTSVSVTRVPGYAPLCWLYWREFSAA